MVDLFLSWKIRLFLSNHVDQITAAIVLNLMIFFLLHCFVRQRSEQRDSISWCWFFRPIIFQASSREFFVIGHVIKIWPISFVCLWQRAHQFGLSFRVRICFFFVFFLKISAEFMHLCKWDHKKNMHLFRIFVFHNLEKIPALMLVSFLCLMLIKAFLTEAMEKLPLDFKFQLGKSGPLICCHLEWRRIVS